MAVVIINHNPLRLLARHFLYIHRPNAFAMQLQAKYTCSTEADGELGTIELVHVYEVPVYNLRPSVMLLADGDMHTQDRMKAAGAFTTDMLQICLFHFLRRRDEAFKNLLDRELLRAGIEITRQSTLL